MKKLFFLLFLLPLFAVAQKVITHTVKAKESLSSIGRLYNINGRELATYNNIDYEKGLTLGQVLKIPAAGAATEAPKTEVVKPVNTPARPVPVIKTILVDEKKATPVYHTVAKKQTLYAISKLHNTTVADIKKWNNLIADALSEGTKIIVGYSNTNKEEQQQNTIAVIKEPKTIKKVPEKDIPVTNNTVESVKPAEIKSEVPQPVKKYDVAPPQPVIEAKAADFKGGIFKNVYDDQVKGNQLVTETGDGGIFKSTSGWQDGKYYCLHNNAAAGTILKITNNATGKSIYAKVLDLIPDIKQNNGLIIRISNAAASALGAGENKLYCTINYSK
ncbi:LysM peptidoglycan-binding domain-containing protein [Ferruginibacter sp.]